MKNFNEIYAEVYKENAEELEYLRKRVIKKVMIIIFIFLTIGGMLSYIVNIGMFLMLPIFIILLYLTVSKSKKQYDKMFKENIITRFVKQYDNELNFDHDRGIARITYLQAEFERFDIFESEDLISGTLEGIYPIKMGEVKTKKESTDEDGHRTTYTLFHGLFANVKLDKILNSSIKIRKNEISLFKGKERLKMDSGEFERKFNVYTSDKIVAMQLLTADIMQMLLDFRKTNNIIPEITIKRNDFYIRFSTGEVFEGSLLKRALDYDVLKKYYDIINFTLNLTQKFLKNISETEV